MEVKKLKNVNFFPFFIILAYIVISECKEYGKHIIETLKKD